MPKIDFLTVLYSSIEKSCTFTIILIPTALTVATIQLARRSKTLALLSLLIMMGPSFFLHGLAFILFTVTVHAEWTPEENVLTWGTKNELSKRRCPCVNSVVPEAMVCRIRGCRRIRFRSFTVRNRVKYKFKKLLETIKKN